MALDPVCGMTVDSAKAAGHFEHKGTTYHFCSHGCLHAFSAVMGLLTPAMIVTAFITGWPSIIAVILNYVKRSEVRGTWLDSHFSWIGSSVIGRQCQSSPFTISLRQALQVATFTFMATSKRWLQDWLESTVKQNRQGRKSTASAARGLQ